MTDLAESLVERGVEVTAVAGRGSYNGGATYPAGELYRGVRVERAWSSGFGKKSLWGRLADYLSFYVGAFVKLWRLERHDIIMALTTPPLIGCVAIIVGRARGMRVVALVQDVYPDVAVKLGALPAGGLATRVFERMNRFVLGRADRVVVLGDCMRERIVEKIGAERASRIDVIHNWADGQKITPLAADEPNPFRVEHDLGDKFVVMFSGNFGRVNEFTTVLEAARVLRERAEIVFLFVGDGALASEIKDFVSAHQLCNIRLLPYQPRASLRHSLAAGDALLVTLAEGLAGLSVPSKTYAILAAGRPVLFVGDKRSDAARIVANHACGAVIEAGESEELATTIREWSQNKTGLATCGVAARRLFERSFDRAQAVDLYLATFAKCLHESSEHLMAGQQSRPSI